MNDWVKEGMNDGEVFLTHTQKEKERNVLLPLAPAAASSPDLPQPFLSPDKAPSFLPPRRDHGSWGQASACPGLCPPLPFTSCVMLGKLCLIFPFCKVGVIIPPKVVVGNK